ncbi:hypothetical protein TNIN_381831 [Trichonephila inaurata madagascariensis]|uniref:Uncharacterized protein n=1 Tax=Trichonephila inaurata madagascariensis TaxID=2747483 RepID=A0A8X7CKP9_9ARAC|nr:hypothetical protein TNIN_381831 [Trichonephila inaurata madagascariensis]
MIQYGFCKASFAHSKSEWIASLAFRNLEPKTLLKRSRSQTNTMGEKGIIFSRLFIRETDWITVHCSRSMDSEWAKRDGHF